MVNPDFRRQKSQLHVSINNNFIVIHEEHLVRRHLTVRLDAMFKAIKFPAGVADLATGLTNVD